MYVAVTESSELPQDNGLVLKIRLMGDEAYVSNYVEPGVNVMPEMADPFKTDAGLGFATRTTWPSHRTAIFTSPRTTRPVTSGSPEAWVKSPARSRSSRGFWTAEPSRRASTSIALASRFM